MICAVCKRWPQHAFWITTGIVDAKYGHAAPPEHGFPSTADEQPSSTRYFMEVIALRDAAMKCVPEWLEIDDPELNDELAGTDRILTALVGDRSFASKPLAELRQRAEFASKLRESEIALHGDMPNLDYEETATVLQAVEHALQQAVNRTAVPTDMTELLASRTAAIEKLKQRIENYRRTSEREDRERALRR